MDDRSAYSLSNARITFGNPRIMLLETTSIDIGIAGNLEFNLKTFIFDNVCPKAILSARRTSSSRVETLTFYWFPDAQCPYYSEL